MPNEHSHTGWDGAFDHRHAQHAAEGIERMEEMVEIVDDAGFSKRLLAVGASGYLASSYCLFVQNVIKPALYYIYTPCGRLSGNAAMVTDELTLLGSAVGMVVAGHCADLWGRKKLYGWELLTLIVATIGTAQASEGFRSQHDGTYDYSTDVYSWLAWWRFVLGLAIGAEHPLVTTITAEWAATQSRGVMLALVFSMLPVARLLAYGIGLAALRISSARNGLSPDLRLEDDANLLTKHVADQVWRWDIGVAVIPAACAVVFRFTIPETPRFHAHIRKNLAKAMRMVREFLPGETTTETISSAAPPSSFHSVASSDTNSISDREVGGWKRWTNWLMGANTYLHQSAAGRDNLLVMAALCFLSEIGWYCLSKDSHSSMSTLFHDASAPGSQPEKRSFDDTKCPEFNAWNSNPTDDTATIYRELASNSTRFMLVSSVGSILGSITLVAVIDRFHRKTILLVSFAALAILFTISGAILTATYDPNSNAVHPSVDVLFGIMHFFYTLGPRTVIYILAAEIFPTEYRGSFYGLIAASGKVAAIAIRPVIGRTSRLPRSLGIRLIFVVPLLVVAAWLCRYLPVVQRGEGQGEDVENRRGKSKTGRIETMKLEEISESPGSIARRIT